MNTLSNESYERSWCPDTACSQLRWLSRYSLPSGFVCAAGKELPELTRPLSKVEALNLALAKNGTIRQARKEVEAAAGIAIQTRAILFPTLQSWSGLRGATGLADRSEPQPHSLAGAS